MGTDLPRVAVIGTGGSISTVARNSLDLFEYADFGRTLEVDELLARVPEAASVAEPVPVRYKAILSAAITPADWLGLTALVQRTAAAEPRPAGIVVTHGTNTLEETAYFLNLAVKTAVPVVVVGAQRPPNGLGSDAGINLVNAIRAAASPALSGLGVVVLLNDAIHAAREVTKTATYRLEAFRAPEFGPLGHVDADGRVAVYRAPVRRRAPDTAFDVRGVDSLPRVDIAYSYAGADGAAIDAFVAAGARAIVSAGLPPGRGTPAEIEALVRARAAGVVVVQSSRAGTGRVIARARLRDAGFVAADNLTPQKARVLAMLALTLTTDPARLQTLFDEH